MSATPPPAPKDAAKKELTNAVIWTVLAAAFAVFMFVRSADEGNEKKNFYLLAGGIGAVVTAVNGYNAWVLYQKSKQTK
jgi:hypothetical protein